MDLGRADAAAVWGDGATIDDERRRGVDVEVLGELDRGIDGGFSSGKRGACGDLGGVEARLGDGAVQSEGGSVGGCQTVLAFEHSPGKGEEGGAAAQLGDAHAVCGGASCLLVLRQGVVLKNDVSLGEVDGQLFHVGLGFLAVRAFEVGKLDQFQILGG